MQIACHFLYARKIWLFHLILTDIEWLHWMLNRFFFSHRFFLQFAPCFEAKEDSTENELRMKFDWLWTGNNECNECDCKEMSRFLNVLFSNESQLCYDLVKKPLLLVADGGRFFPWLFFQVYLYLSRDFLDAKWIVLFSVEHPHLRLILVFRPKVVRKISAYLILLRIEFNISMGFAKYSFALGLRQSRRNKLRTRCVIYTYTFTLSSVYSRCDHILC